MLEEGEGMEMTFLEAIEKRSSRRSYLSKAIEPDKIERLKEAIDKYNDRSAMSIQFIEDGSKAFGGLRKSYGMFSGVRSFIALAGKTDDPNLKEKAGYYGELLVLEATTLGLGTCFVGASYDKKSCPCKVEEDETLTCVITVGYVNDSPVLKERVIHRIMHMGKTQLKNPCESGEGFPPWFVKGVRSVQLAPSAVNRRPVKLAYESGKASAYVDSKGGYNLMDLGIAKANFEIAAGGRFELGNHGAFTKE